MVDSSREASAVALREAAFREFRKNRKGYLVDAESFIAGWQASRSSAIEECAEACKLVAVACEDVYDGMPQIEQAAREAANECAAAILALKGEG